MPDADSPNDAPLPNADAENEIAPRMERKATLRFGQRELGLFSAAIILIIVVSLGFGVYRMFVNFRSQRDIVIAQSNLHALWTAMQSYAEDWNGHLPPADHWTEAVAGYLPSSSGSPGGKMAALRGPSDLGQLGYVYNDNLAGYYIERPETEKFKRPGSLVVLIERVGAGDNVHDPIPVQGDMDGEAALFKMLTFPHYADDPENATSLVLFADGNVRRFKHSDLQH